MAAQVAARVNAEFRDAGLSLRGDSMRLVCDFLQQQDDSDEALTQLLQALQAKNCAWGARRCTAVQTTGTDSLLPCTRHQWPAPSSPLTTCAPPWPARQPLPAAPLVVRASVLECSLWATASRL